MKVKQALKQFQERVIYSLNNKRISIRTKIFCIVGLFIILNILINLFIVKVSINNIYLGLEKKELKKEYSLIKNNINNHEEILNIIYNANDNGIKIKILDSNLNVVLNTLSDRLNAKFSNFDLMLLNSLEKNNTKIITLENNKKNGYDLYLIGKMGNDYIILSSSIESLKNDANTSLVIILITSIITFLILCLVAYFISKIFSKKINELKEVTSDISNLKFGKKININTNDELGDLFNNINKMSDNLEDNIKKLEEANKKLKEDLVEKERQEKARKQLIANISHEFKTPLTIISGYSQLMLSDTKNEEEKKNLELIINESERLSDLVHEFLELSKLESGNISLKKEDININKIILKEIEKLNNQIESKKIKIETNFTDDAIVKVDQKQITKVIENILTNAVKFVKKSNLIKISTHTKDNYFYYEVFNTGDKIKKEDMENIFNCYYKDKSTRNKKGTGLGLTIVKAIVDLHNGKCKVDNIDEGVKFTIIIPKEDS